MAAERFLSAGDSLVADASASGSAPPVKQRKPDRRRIITRRAITSSAAELFAERGADATTVDEIAAHAGLSVGTLYFHYGSKEGVVLALVERVLEAADAALAQARAEGDALERLLHTGDLYLRFALEQPVAFRFVAEGVTGPSGDGQAATIEMGERITERIGAFLSAVRADLTEAMEDGAIERIPLDEAVALVWGTWNGVAGLASRHDGFQISRDLAERTLRRGRRALVAGLGGALPAHVE